MLRCDLVNYLARYDSRLKFYPRVSEGAHASIWCRLDCHCKDCKDFGAQEMICAIPHTYIPEYTVIDRKTERIVKRGWREIFRIMLATHHAGKPLFDKQRLTSYLGKNGFYNLNKSYVTYIGEA